MLEEYGTVIAVQEAQIAVVLCGRSSACDHCAASGACQTVGDGADGATMQVEAFNPIGAKIHDRVKLVTSTRHFLQSSFILYIVPVIGLLIGALIGQAIGELTAVELDPSLLSAILGVAFLVGTFLCIKVGTRALKREIFMPRIVEILAPAASQADAEHHGY